MDDVVEAVGAAVRCGAAFRRFHSPGGAGRGKDQMTEIPEDVKRWTARQRSALVLEMRARHLLAASAYSDAAASTTDLRATLSSLIPGRHPGNGLK